MPPPLRIRVLGAGVAGLSASIALAADGHHVELIDELFEVPSVGTALGIFASAQRAMDQLGVLDAVQRVSASPRSGTVHGRDGRVLATLPAGDALLVARSDLVRILQEAVPEQVRRTQRRIADVRPLREDADLLLGADGVHSLVRRSGWPGRTAARSHGVTVLRGTAGIAPPEVSETWGGGWLFGITPLANSHDPADSGGTNWFACIPEHRTASVQADLEHLRTRVGNRRTPIDAVLAAARPEATSVHGIHTAPLVTPVRENVVLLGDAAHAMAPNLGHGANTALEDAVALADALRTESARDDPSRTVRSALRTYALRRTLPGQGWRIGSGALLRVAMMQERAALRDGLLSGLGRLASPEEVSSASGRVS
ncbi:FAD-dependent monooxygenase [Brachybacterium sp. FME24]|uniref:FAD-dependent monooxygenase n=1 Tax=Brachybacterium sp. FME24 TaxID=2742605 RepID=UPI001D01A113|nr:FAD-dependent monooxygenase [Brachybacterium sp. FME24]